MRHILLFITALLLAPAAASAQAPADKDLKALFEMAQSRGIETELRGDISDRLGFGDHPLPIKDLVVTKDGVQHAVDMKPGDDELVISAEESFWRQWIADGAELPAQ